MPKKNSDIKLLDVAEKMQSLDDSDLKEDFPPRWKRWLSIYVLYFAMVDSLSTYSIVMSSLFPYLLQLTNGQASTVLLGGVVAGYCFGQLVAAPILGFWSDRRSAKEPLMVCFSVSIVANIAYCYASALPSGGEYVVIVARVAMGGCAGISAIVRSYIAHSTTEKERSLGLAGVSGSQTLGLFIGPLLALLFVPLGDNGISIPAIRFHFNMYTGPVYLSALLDIVCIVLIAVMFREYKIKFDEGREDIPSEKSGVDWFAVMVTLFIVFVMYSTVPVLESIMVPYSMDEFAWNREQAVLYNNIIFGFLAILAIVSYIVIGVIVKWVELRVMMMIGLVVLGCSFLIFIPMSNQIPESMGIAGVNSTAAVAAVGCRNRHLNWCIELPQLLLPQYIVGLIVLTAGYSMSVLPTFTLYSRLLGPFRQGMLMGVLSSVNSLAQGIAPLFVTYMYDHTGPQITFGAMVGIVSLGIITLMIFCYRMVPYGQKRRL